MRPREKEHCVVFEFESKQSGFHEGQVPTVPSAAVSMWKVNIKNDRRVSQAWGKASSDRLKREQEERIDLCLLSLVNSLKFYGFCC